MTNLHNRMLSVRRINPANYWIPVRLASDWATPPCSNYGSDVSRVQNFQILRIIIILFLLLPTKDRVPWKIIGPASCDMTGKHSNPPKHLFLGRIVRGLLFACHCLVGRCLAWRLLGCAKFYTTCTGGWFFYDPQSSPSSGLSPFVLHRPARRWTCSSIWICFYLTGSHGGGILHGWSDHCCILVAFFTGTVQSLKFLLRKLRVLFPFPVICWTCLPQVHVRSSEMVTPRHLLESAIWRVWPCSW